MIGTIALLAIFGGMFLYVCIDTTVCSPRDIFKSWREDDNSSD